MCHATMQVLCSPESNGSDLYVKFVCQWQAISPYHLFKDCWKSSTSSNLPIQNLNQFFFTCIQIKYISYIALAFVGCPPLEFYHPLEKDPMTWGFPTSKPPKEARSAQPWSSVPSMTWEKLELHLQAIFLKIQDTSNFLLLWYMAIYCYLYIYILLSIYIYYLYIYAYIYIYWIWRLSWRNPLQKRESVLLMKSPQYFEFCALKKLPLVMKEERHGRQYICKNFSQQALQLHVSPMYTYYDLHSSDHVAFSHFHHWLNQTFDHWSGQGTPGAPCAKGLSTTACAGKALSA